MQHFNELLKINKEIIFEEDNVRTEKLDEVYQMLDNFYSKEFDLDEFIKLCIILFNMQLFYDGNSRTIITYFIKVINNQEYKFDYAKATDGLIKLKQLFPIMYDLNEELDDYDIFKLKQYIHLKK